MFCCCYRQDIHTPWLLNGVHLNGYTVAPCPHTKKVKAVFYVHLSYLFGDSESSLLVIAGEQHNPNSHPLESSYCSLRLMFNCVCYSHHSHK